MSGKRWIIAAVFIFVCMNLAANEQGFTFRPYYGGGGFSGVIGGTGDYGLGGVGEFAFLFYDKGLQMGLSFIGRGDGITTELGNNYGTGSILGKVSFGGFFPVNFLRSYTFVEGGVGFGGGNGTAAMNLIFGGGGGIDLFYHRTGSIYLEVGYLQHYINNELMGGVSLVIGSRGYFR